MNIELKEIQLTFSAAGNLARAEKMSAYMKHQFPFYGVPAPQRKALYKPILAILKSEKNSDQTWKLIFELWAQKERELKYLALEILRKTPKKNYSPDDFEKLEYLITTEAWWDTVDLIASNYLTNLTLFFPKEGARAIEKWRDLDNLWLKRSCLLFQLKLKSATNTALLESLILDFYPLKDFFIQKAIGWSLREYAKTDPQFVVHFIEKNKLEGLAKREALRNLK